MIRMNQAHKEQIEKIIEAMECSKNFKCYKSGFTDICKVKDIGHDSVFECLGEYSYGCEFREYFGHSYYCKCPLRVYLAKELKI